MMKLEGVVAFVMTSEAGSISMAARRLGLAKSVVSERLAELERTLGTTLIQRSTRKLSLTGSGLTFLPRAQRILREAEEATSELAARSGKLVGPLRISAPVGFGILHLGPAVGRFLRDYPEIELSLELDDSFVDAATGGFDAVLRHGAMGDGRLIARRLASSRRLLVASPGYLDRNGTPATLGDLERHSAILYSNRASDWRFSALENGRSRSDGGWSVVRPRAALRVNSGLVMRDAAMEGLGIALLPTFFVHNALASGALIEVNIGLQAEGAELFLAYPKDHGAAAKIRAFGDSLRRSFGTPPYWEKP
ncbi:MULTISPECIES: LysR family transcriptional regulator [Sphingobium]|uniref:LysR family transcriptional regulator n=1 Tax=Sphingobium fuliginis (strain ATCC 27551) TaxID=336203 RepID=A0ABQ1EX03_SPHSA|nr:MULTISPECIES: LysR family transcriptional regulator [Sphingobium]RYL98188.1 LysR family transcriptional regulator [Sphingobium fuliginis]WDA34906.1 LysR family transcriptional regulator [Sphingobium sp. YC-XJ3]GFZ91243.1 LysR family transcriptional regulator [Sphingobium fuliginis]